MKQNNATIRRSLTGKAQNKLLHKNNQSSTNGAPSKSSLAQSQKSDDDESLVDTKMPSRDRAIQTEKIFTKAVGIQCRRDSFDDWELMYNQPEPKEQDEEIEKKAILLYVRRRTNMFPNGMLECRVCGEVANYFEEHRKHMIMHYGPRALCSDCGHMVAHQNSLLKHSYSCPARPNAKLRPVIHMQCPHPQCDFMVSSKRKLSGHIKNHINSYHCLTCLKKFGSFSRLQMHRMMVTACRKAKFIYISPSRSKLRKKLTSTRCTVCFKRFSSVRCCKLHKRRCIFAYHKRLRKLLRPYIKKI